MDPWRTSRLRKMLARARSTVYWSNMQMNLTEKLQSCPSCLRYARVNPKRWPDKTLPLGPEIPLHPRFKLASDIFHFNGTDYLLVVDYMSLFPVIWRLSNQTSKAVIEQMKSIFAEYGVPDTLITDNGPCYDSKEFKWFTQKYNFEHVTSSPHYHEGNGLAEKYVDIIKNWLQKALDSKEDPYKSMFIYQTTPLNSQLPSPMELLNKHTYTDLPISNLRRSMIRNDHTNINLRNQRNSDPKVQTR